jgi:hypothetical protein
MKMRSMEKQIDVVVKSTVARLAEPESAEVPGEFQVSGRGFPRPLFAVALIHLLGLEQQRPIVFVRRIRRGPGGTLRRR